MHTRVVMGSREGCYGCTRGLLWVHVRADMGTHKGCYGFM